MAGAVLADALMAPAASTDRKSDDSGAGRWQGLGVVALQKSSKADGYSVMPAKSSSGMPDGDTAAPL